MPINWTNSARYVNSCHTPGNTGKDPLFSLFAADQAYSGNWSNLRDPAVDTLIDHLYKARNWSEFVAACRALDRVLLWNFYWLPNSSKTDYALAYWDKFGIPDHGPLIRETAFADLWWWDAEKAARVAGFVRSK